MISKPEYYHTVPFSVFHSEDDSDEEEDDTAELLRELEKIKRERAEEKARQVRARFLNEDSDPYASVRNASNLIPLLKHAMLRLLPQTLCLIFKQSWDRRLVARLQDHLLSSVVGMMVYFLLSHTYRCLLCG